MALDPPLFDHGPASVVFVDDDISHGLLDQRIAPAAVVDGSVAHPHAVGVLGVAAGGQIRMQHKAFAVCVVLKKVSAVTLGEAAAVEDGIN